MTCVSVFFFLIISFLFLAKASRINLQTFQKRVYKRNIENMINILFQVRRPVVYLPTREESSEQGIQTTPLSCFRSLSAELSILVP